MGTYATTTSLQIIMVGVNFNTLTTSLATKMISQAEAEVNRYLSKRYDLTSNTFHTSTSIPPLVTALTERMAEGYMWKAQSRGGKESLKRGEDLIKETRESLQAIAQYKMDLLDTSGSVIVDMSNTSYRVLCNTTNYTPTFNEDSELLWQQDSDKLDDIYNERD